LGRAVVDSYRVVAAMSVLIRLDTMQVVYRHPSKMALQALAHIELSGVAFTIKDEMYWHENFTDMQVRMMHASLFGRVTTSLERMREQITDTVCTLPESRVNGMEAEIQAGTIAFDDLRFYRYVPHAYVPQLVDELFTTAVTVPRVQQAEIDSLQGGAGGDRVVAFPTTAATTAAPSAQPQPAATGQKAVIWAAADAAWSALGNTKDENRILSMRKQVMDHLEAQGVKRSSASSSLGEWWKARRNG
jgi:hypothetical protein